MSRQQSLYSRIRAILESARVTVARSVNTAQVIACWLIGHEIVEEEQAGKARAEYGEKLLADLADKFKKRSYPGLFSAEPPVYAPVLSRLSGAYQPSGDSPRSAW